MTIRKQLIKKLDKKFKDIVLKRDNYTCVLCGGAANTAGHIITRVYYNLRWDLKNIHASCRGCNLSHEHRPYIFINWYIKKYGFLDWLNMCEKAAPAKFTDKQLVILLNEEVDGENQ